MTGKTSIEWATAVWNPTTGCTRVSAGCDNCYAFALHDKRYEANLDHAKFMGHDSAIEGRALLDIALRDPNEAASIGRGDMPPWPRQYDLPFSRVQLLPGRLDDPLRHRKPERYFVDSMSDLFHEDVPDEYLDRVFGTMEMVSSGIHKFLILTKRPERMREYLTARWTPNDLWPNGYRPSWIWLGTSVEDQAAADERIPHLLATPAAVRFLSCEPLLGPVDLTGQTFFGCPVLGHARHDEYCRPNLAAKVDWVIVGGESGPRARPMDLAWARALVAQCRAAGVAPFVKQLGSKPVSTVPTPLGGTMEWTTRESHGRDMAEWPEDLKIREFPR